MSEPAENTHQSPLAGQLSLAQGLVESGNFKDALALLKQVKALDSRNIYILAFEKQVEQLVEFSDMNILTDEQRTDILESIPGIIQRALEASAPEFPETMAEQHQTLKREREERSAALEWLKNQYFQHAHEYVRKGEYTHALAEIRRVYIIDPSNKIAEDFEHQIEQLIALRKVQTMPRTPARPTFAPSAGSTTERPAVVLPARPPVRSEPVRLEPVRSEPAPRPPAPPAVPQVRGPEAEPEKWRPGRGLLIGVAFTVIAVLLAAFYFFGRRPSTPSTNPAEPPPSGVTPPAEDSYAPMESSQQQGFVVSLSERNGSISARVTPEMPALRSGRSDETGFPMGGSSRESRSASSTEQKSTPKGSPEHSATAAESSRPAGSEGSAAGGGEPSSLAELNPAGSLTEEARIIRLERPQFTGGMNPDGLEGQVVVRVEIDRNGFPRQTNIVRSTNSLLDAAVLAAVNKSTFSPRRTSSGPVNSWMTIPFTFRSSK